MFHRRADVAAFTQSHQLGGLANWHFLWGEPAYTQDVLASFGMAIDVPTVGMIEHSSGVLFVSADGRQAAYLEDGAALPLTASYADVVERELRGRRSDLASVLAGVVAALVAGCTACSTSQGSSAPSADSSRQPLAQPYVLMTDGRTGVLVWPSGPNWLLLSTTDGFAHVTDRTPPAVDTGGGLAVAAAGTRTAAAIGPVERLVRSPLVTANTDTDAWRWQPAELPGAVAADRGAVALAGGAVDVVLRDGRVVGLAHGRSTTLTSAARLARGDGFHPDAVTADGSGGVLVTGHGGAGRPTAYRSTDAGRTWSALPGTGGTTVAALAPCATPAGPAVPVVDGTGLRIVAPGGAAGATVEVGAGAVALGCSGASVLVVDARGRVEASADAGRHWSTRGAAPHGRHRSRGDRWRCRVRGVRWAAAAAVARHRRRRRFVRVPLPGWVARLGAGSGGD